MSLMRAEENEGGLTDWQDGENADVLNSGWLACTKGVTKRTSRLTTFIVTSPLVSAKKI